MRVALLLCVVGAVVIAWSVKYGDLRVGSPGPLLPRAVPVLGMLVFCLGLLVSGTGRCPPVLERRPSLHRVLQALPGVRNRT